MIIFYLKLFQNSNCKGTVLINSTVGYQSLYHSVPVKSFGISPYNIEGLIRPKRFSSFFKNPNQWIKKFSINFINTYWRILR